MHDENVLLESRSLRDSLAARDDALDKVKALELLPDGLHVTTEIVADYFGVHRDIIRKLTQRHRGELTANGMTVLRGADLQRFKRDILSLYREGYPQPPSNLTLYTRRTVLNVAMLLRDSAVARRVRTYLLNTEEQVRAHGRNRGRSLEARVGTIESLLADVGPALRDLGFMVHRMSVRLERVEQRVEHIDRRVDNTERVVCAMSERLADMAADLKDLRARAVVMPTRPRRRPRRR